MASLNYAHRVAQALRHGKLFHLDLEDIDGAWTSAAGCMRNYLILKEKSAPPPVEIDEAIDVIAVIEGAQRSAYDGSSSIPW